MASYSYKTSGTCSVEITIDMQDDIVTNIHFERGCNGNTKGISVLANGMKAEDLIGKLAGIRCREKNTSCPDQLAKAVQNALEENAQNE